MTMSTRKVIVWLAVGWLLLVLLVACGQKETPTPTPTPQPTPVPTKVSQPTPAQPTPTKAEAEQPKATPEEAGDVTEVAVAAMQRVGCGGCHVIPGVPNANGQIGPDLSAMGQVAAQRLQDPNYKGKAKDPAGYIRESIVEPDAYIAPECPSGPCMKGQMPNLSGMLSEAELNAIVQYLAALPSEEVAAPVEATPETTALKPPPLTPEEFEKAKQIYFNRCAGCHGTLRKGATGPALTPDRTLPKGTAALASIIYNGTPGGMPDWGKQGVLTKEETELMAKFIQHEPPAPPEMSLAQMKETWKLYVPVDQRPTEPQYKGDWENLCCVIERDVGRVAIIDGDTKEIVARVPTGFATHICRMSATGRYVYTIGRDGKASLIDLWTEKPTLVAEVKVCYDARSIDSSKYKGELGDFLDQYAVVGCYWPPHFVILDGQTLEPIKIVSTRSYTYDTEEYHPEPRVASIVASHFKPRWILSIKETGMVWLVDYRDPNNPTIKMIEAERFLHDGGWDATGRYFLVAANKRNKIAVVDAKEEKLVALIETGKLPHPGRGVNFEDPEYGPVWCTGHLGEPLLACIGTDPEGYPEYAWKVVRRIELPGSGTLFVKSHPNSRWIWVDFTLNPDEKLQRSVCVIDKQNPTEVAKCWQVADYGRAVHFEYNKAGDEVWVSVWGKKDDPGRTGEIVIYDAETLEEKARIKGLVTPTGKFNVYNTARDIY